MLCAYHLAGNPVIGGPCPACAVLTISEEEKVDHPKHYNLNPSGVECIDVVEHYNFNIGNAMKYLWRAGLKGSQMEDLEKARWYVEREIQRVKKG